MYDTEVMQNREDRLAAIRRLVSGGRISSQAEMLDGLRRKGVRIDQSTLSRDLAEVGARKRSGRYVLESGEAKPVEIDFAGAVRSFVTCGPHLIVIATGVGQAQFVAVSIEKQDEPAIAGVLAGDDTIFVAVKNGRSQSVVVRRFKQWFGDKHEA
jgi:transcriptional regulator of arginine metabolism